MFFNQNFQSSLNNKNEVEFIPKLNKRSSFEIILKPPPGFNNNKLSIVPEKDENNKIINDASDLNESIINTNKSNNKLN